jgi:hypothetical protein
VSDNTGITINVWASKTELMNAKSGGSTLVASKAKTKEADIQILVPLQACDILDDEVRVNVTLIKQSIDNLGKTVGEAMGKELEKVFKQFAE